MYSRLIPVLFLAEDACSSIGRHIHCRTLVLEEVQMLGTKKGQLVPFLLSILLFGAAVVLFIVLLEGFFFLTDILVSLYQFVLKIQFMNKLWGQSGSLLPKYSVEQFYVFVPAKGWWSPCSVSSSDSFEGSQDPCCFCSGLLTVWGVVKATSENYSWFNYHTAANLFKKMFDLLPFDTASKCGFLPLFQNKCHIWSVLQSNTL